jgi:CIC family chloride channel protein
MVQSIPSPVAPGRPRTRLKLRTRLRILARSGVRNSDLGLVVVAAFIGGLVGLVVAFVQRIVRELHHVLFGIEFDSHLSDRVTIDARRIVAALVLGGLAYGVIAYLVRRWRPTEIVDAIEANALYGGQMSLTDSIRLAVLTILSAGVGASVGLEAAYTQLGSGIASRIGRALRLRRADLRIFVGCGAAAAIAAAFNAPLAGAFYAFELIIGSYTMATLTPIALAALAGAAVERLIFGAEPIFAVTAHIDLVAADYALLTLLGLAAAAVGIGTMVGVTLVEGWFRRIGLPIWLRPAVGGAALAGMALAYPQILGSGHGGIVSTISSSYDFVFLLGLFAAKLAASAISIGSGFRGGMFSSSLFLGSLFGGAAGTVLTAILPWASADRIVYVLAGMGAVAAAVVGAPITMILLVLEATSDFSATVGVTVAVIVASFTVRNWFGYSFATWRFHIRGVPLRGAQDIGWLHDFTVGRLMRRDVVTVPTTMKLRQLRELFPVGGAKYAFAIDEEGRFAGVIDTQEANGADLDARVDEVTAGDLARGAAHFLTPDQPVRLALNLFLGAEAEVLAVVSDPIHRHPIGYLTEAYALRRYNRELEQRRQEEYGDDALFSVTRPRV